MWDHCDVAQYASYACALLILTGQQPNLEDLTRDERQMARLASGEVDAVIF